MRRARVGRGIDSIEILRALAGLHHAEGPELARVVRAYVRAQWAATEYGQERAGPPATRLAGLHVQDAVLHELAGFASYLERQASPPPAEERATAEQEQSD